MLNDDRISPAELKTVSRFAYKCFGFYNLSLMACMEIARYARGWPNTIGRVKSTVFRVDLQRIGKAYREVMDVIK